MYSAKTNVFEIAFKQYLYKLKALSFLGLIILQAIALLFSSSGLGMYGSGNGGFSVHVKIITSDIVIVFTMVWAFAIAVGYTKKYHKDIDFTLVSNRLSSSLSDSGLFLTISILGALTSTLAGMLLRVILYFTTDHSLIISGAFKLPFLNWFQSFFAVVMYLLLICGAGYLFGMLIEVNRLFAFIIPASFFGLARGQNDLFLSMIRFFTKEPSLLLFAGKAIFTAAILLTLSLLIFNRMEVRR